MLIIPYLLICISDNWKYSATMQILLYGKHWTCKCQRSEQMHLYKHKWTRMTRYCTVQPVTTFQYLNYLWFFFYVDQQSAQLSRFNTRIRLRISHWDMGICADWTVRFHFNFWTKSPSDLWPWYFARVWFMTEFSWNWRSRWDGLSKDRPLLVLGRVAPYLTWVVHLHWSKWRFKRTT